MKKLDPRIYEFIREHEHLSNEELILHLRDRGYTNARGGEISLLNVQEWKRKIRLKKKPNGKNGVVLSIRDEGRLYFAEIWNDPVAYTSKHDLMRALGDVSWNAILARKKRYEDYLKANPNSPLPELIWRKSISGGFIPVPQSMIRQLDPFRFDLKKLKNAKGVVVTAAQFGAPLNKAFWESLKGYAAYRGFLLIVLPIQYGPSKIDKQGNFTSLFPEELLGHVTFDDIPLQEGTLNLSTVRMRPTLIRFLPRSVCNMGGAASQIIAAPKFELEHQTRPGHNNPKAIMTSGAVTQPNYAVDKLGQQDRTGEIATAEHTYGAIVVEFEGKDAFHFRQLGAGSKGMFYDIDPIHGGARLFTATGNSHQKDAVDTIVCGDMHLGKTDPVVYNGTFKGKTSMASALRPANFVLHDLFDCESASHWDVVQAVRRAYKAYRGWDNLQLELDDAIKELAWMKKNTSATIHVIASNHNEFVARYVNGMNWLKDNINMIPSAKLLLGMFEDLVSRNPEKNEARPIDPVSLYINKHLPDIQTHDRQSMLLLPKLPHYMEKKQLLLSMHGDIGPKGGRTASLDIFRDMNQRMIIAHGHSAQILGPIWRVGTSTYRKAPYVNNPKTAWTNTHAIVFKNGQRMLINFYKGKWHGYRRNGYKKPQKVGAK